MHELQNKWIFLSVKILAVPFQNLLKANGKLWFYNFSYAKKRNFRTLQLQCCVFFSSNGKVQLAPHVRDGSANLKDEDLAEQANDASESSFLHTMHWHVGRQFLFSFEVTQVPHLVFRNWKNILRVLVPSFILNVLPLKNFVSPY